MPRGLEADLCMRRESRPMRLMKLAAAIFLGVAFSNQSCSQPNAPEQAMQDGEDIQYESAEFNAVAGIVSSSVLGWNLDFVYGGGFVFANKMNMARSWVSCTNYVWNDG